MRTLSALLALFLLCGCPAPSQPEDPKPEGPQPERADPDEVQTPTPENQAPPSLPADYEGVWSATDAQGRNFDTVIFPNGQAVTNRTGTATGSRGLWRLANGRCLVFFDNGSTHNLQSSPEGYRYSVSAPGDPQDRPKDESSITTKVEEAKAPFVGIWRMNKEPDGSYLYLSLHANGQAQSTINGGTQGRWELTPKGALCHWPDGWVDLIERIPGGWQKRSWVGAESDAPADLSKATRVGETAFAITP